MNELKNLTCNVLGLIFKADFFLKNDRCISASIFGFVQRLIDAFEQLVQTAFGRTLP